MKKKQTKDEAWIRVQIRNAIRAYKKDEGMPYFYSSDHHEYSHRLTPRETTEKDKQNKEHYYYVKSDRAIASAAKKIYERMKNGL